jgi:kumamolisin
MFIYNINININIMSRIKNYLHKNITPLTQPNISYNGSDLLKLYNVPSIPPSNGKRKIKIAIIIAYHYKNLLNDLKIFWTRNSKLPSPSLTVHNLSNNNSNFNSVWAGEECLDLQIVCIINPNADIHVVEAISNNSNHLTSAITYAINTIKADVITMSWGGTDVKSNSEYNKYFNSNSNICFCASTGDSNYVSWPAVLSNCLAVGGTSLMPSSSFSPETKNFGRIENTWNLAGCGYSLTIPRPSFQDGVFLNTQKKRIIPDVSLIANPNTGFNMVFNGKWTVTGGTSLSAPFMAAILSIANQQRLNQNKSLLTTNNTKNNSTKNNSTKNNSVQNYLYKTIYPNKNLYSKCFNTVNKSSNSGTSGGSNGELTKYNTIVGFDIPTGLGSPNCKALCNQLLQLP